jgi:hypothetical protein
MHRYFLFLLFLLFLFMNKDGYTNYVDYHKPFTNPIITCPENYSKNFNHLLEHKKTIQPFGYTKNEYLDKTRFIESDIPLPVNPDFFY